MKSVCQFDVVYVGEVLVFGSSAVYGLIKLYQQKNDNKTSVFKRTNKGRCVVD